MEYKDKYRKMAEQFRKDDTDDYRIGKFIREEMERDENAEGTGTNDIEAYNEWRSWPEERRDLYLHKAYCGRCSGVSEFRPGYNVRMISGTVMVEGNCKKCGGMIHRICD